MFLHNRVRMCGESVTLSRQYNTLVHEVVVLRYSMREAMLFFVLRQKYEWHSWRNEGRVGKECWAVKVGTHSGHWTRLGLPELPEPRWPPHRWLTIPWDTSFIQRSYPLPLQCESTPDGLQVLKHFTAESQKQVG